jgi:hypothetical protein
MLALAAPSGQDRHPMTLSARDREILDFERTWRQLPVPKEAAIREQFRISPTRYYELLRSLLDQPDAFAYDPLTVKRAQRVRHHLRRVRIEGRRADQPLSSPSRAPALRQRSAKPPLPRSR